MKWLWGATGVVLLFGCTSRDPSAARDAGADSSAGDVAIEEDAIVEDLAPIDAAGKVLPAGAEEALRKNHEVFCRSYKTCFPVHFANLYGDETTCLATRAKAAAAVLFGPGSTLAVSDISACGAASGTSYTCDQILAIFFENPVEPAACRLKGNLDNGTKCAGSDQCKSGYCRYGASRCGACADRLAAGSACTASSQCTEGLGCAGNVCNPYVATGGACDDTHACHLTDVCKEGKCVARAGFGKECDAKLQDCLFGGHCNTMTNRCEALTSAKLGAQCGQLDGGGYALCDFGLKCSLAGATGSGTCVTAAKEGETCFKTGPTGSQCELPLVCTTRCVLLSTEACK